MRLFVNQPQYWMNLISDNGIKFPWKTALPSYELINWRYSGLCFRLQYAESRWAKSTISIQAVMIDIDTSSGKLFNSNIVKRFLLECRSVRVLQRCATQNRTLKWVRSKSPKDRISEIPNVRKLSRALFLTRRKIWSTRLTSTVRLHYLTIF